MSDLVGYETLAPHQRQAYAIALQILLIAHDIVKKEHSTKAGRARIKAELQKLYKEIKKGRREFPPTVIEKAAAKLNQSGSIGEGLAQALFSRSRADNDLFEAFQEAERWARLGAGEYGASS